MTRRSIEAGKAVIVIDVLDKANASFNKLTSKMMASARGLRNLGQQAAGAGLLTGLVSRGVINNFTDFEDKILNLTAKLGIFGVETDQQKANIKDLTKTIIDLGRVTSYTSAEVADAAISLAQAGFSITEIKSSLKAVLDLARGTGYALGDTADLLANTVRTFNLLKPGNSAAVLAENMATINHVASMMVKATRLGTIEIQDLRE
jgi:TP901 family phage tail tape measure protein